MRILLALALIVIVGLQMWGIPGGALADVPEGSRHLFLPITRRQAPPTPTPVPPTPTPGPVDREHRVLELVNQHRAAHGCAPLTMNQQLVSAARGHSADMAINDFLSHTGSNGSSFVDRINATGYQWSYAAENIAGGDSTAEAVMQRWMASAGHRNNILNCALRDIGVGYYYLAQDTGSTNYRHYWTQVFAAPR